MSTKQQRIAELAKQRPEMGFTSLAHHIDIDWLHEAYRRTRKDGAAGVDGKTARTMSRTWRTTSGRCWTVPSPARTALRRCGGCTSRRGRGPRPGRSGSRPGGQGAPAGGRHGAGADLRAGLSGLLVRLPARAIGAPGAGAGCGSRAMEMGGCWIVEVDIRKFFDTSDHGHLRDCFSSGCETGCCCD